MQTESETADPRIEVHGFDDLDEAYELVELLTKNGVKREAIKLER